MDDSFASHQQNNTGGGMRIFAASDLHIGALYASSRAIEQVENGIRLCDQAVLCGDIFEGTMMQIPAEERIEMGKKALKRWSAANPKATIHLVFGNHEMPLIKGGTPADASYLEVAKTMRAYAESLPNVVFHDKGWLKLGDAIFTHGHVQNNFLEDPPSTLKQWLHLPLNIVLPGTLANSHIFPIKEWATKLHAAFSAQTLNGPVNHIVFGHTHTPKLGYTIPGLRLGGSDHDVQFHNLGASIRGRPQLFQPIMMEQDEQGITQKVSRAAHITQTVRA